MVALAIRKDRSVVVLRKLAGKEKNTRVARRILAIANALCGMSRDAAAKAGGMDRQTLRDWVIRYNEAGIAGLIDRWGDGRPPKLDASEEAKLSKIILDEPDPDTDGICAYTLEDLSRICKQRFGKSFHPASMSRVVRRLGFSRQKARPSHPKTDPASQEAFKKSPGDPERNCIYT